MPEGSRNKTDANNKPINIMYHRTDRTDGGRGTTWAVNSRRRDRDETDETDATDRGQPSTAKPKKYRNWDKDGDNIPDFMEDMWDNSDRKAVGLGCLEKMFGGGQDSVDDQKRDK